MKTLHGQEAALGSTQVLRLALAIIFLYSCGDLGCPIEELVASPIASNLVEYTEPTAGDVVTSFPILTVHFLKPIDTSTFSVAEDVRVTLQKGDQPPLDVDVDRFFDPIVTDPDPAILHLPVQNGVLLLAGDVILVSILGSDEIGDAAVTSLPGNPPGTSSVRLSKTVTVRFVVADPTAGQDGPPSVAVFPTSFLDVAPNPDTPGAVESFVQPHDPLLIRFSEPMGVISVFGTVVGLRGMGSSGGMDFRSFIGRQSILGGKDHTGIVRNGFFYMEPGAVYEFNVLSGADASPRMLPSTKDLSGNELPGTFTKFFRTSHVAILWPYGAPYQDVDLRNDTFIRSGIMAFKVTGAVKWIGPGPGVNFTPFQVDIPFNQTYYVSTNGVQLVSYPSDPGKVCVVAYDAAFTMLGMDCLRTVDELERRTAAVVGKEGGEIRLGKFNLELVKDGNSLPWDGTMHTLGPSFRKAVEIGLERLVGRPDSAFSLSDVYNVYLPSGIEPETPALIWWDFDPTEHGLEADPVSLLLGRTDSEGGFVPHANQFLYKDQKVALVYKFSPQRASLQTKHCAEGHAEIPRCCADQEYYQCDPCYPSPDPDDGGYPFVGWCHCGIGCPGLHSDTGVCRCNHPRRDWYCCKGCVGAMALCNHSCPNPGPQPPECEDEVLADAKKHKCVDCLAANCEETRSSVAGNKGPVVGGSDCPCTIPQNTTVYCADIGTEFCCFVYGPVSGDVDCTNAYPSWPTRPPECNQAWDDMMRQLEAHENAHEASSRQRCAELAAGISGIGTSCIPGDSGFDARYDLERSFTAAVDKVKWSNAFGSDMDEKVVDATYRVDSPCGCIPVP